ncbi:MAG: PorP/SprF family type IX secretion system membrane protein [Flavobacteriia bacterium]|nr:PorP/SprF family type IX secretion system membrane protein [Flavobacteriia bacterium]OJX36175.1 MAG: hypothetical protein BGO87_06835 [Flavobacteriia bacterium 40-80]
MVKNLLKLLILFVLTGNVFAQQDKLLTHFIYDKMTINPGSTGLEKGICGTLIYRNQWDKVNGAPNSAVFNVEANMGRWLPINLGLSFYHDAIGFARQNNLLLNIAYPIPVTIAGGTLSVGVGVGMVNFGMNPTWIPPTQVNDPTLPGSTSATNLDLNGGIYYRHNQGKWFAGISSTHLSESKLIDVNYKTFRHYNLLGGYKFIDLFGANRSLDVQAMMRTDFVKYSADINVRYLHDQWFYAGLTYRTSDALALMIGIIPIQNFVIGYSYDLTLNKLSNISRGTHEIVLRYCYILPPPPVTIHRNPRWL